MDCHYCKRENLPTEAMLSSRKCIECYNTANRDYQREYQRKQRLKKKQQGESQAQHIITYNISFDALTDILSSYVNDKDTRNIMEQIKSTVQS